jgi:hypothetical protein
MNCCGNIVCWTVIELLTKALSRVRLIGMLKRRSILGRNSIVIPLLFVAAVVAGGSSIPSSPAVYATTGGGTSCGLADNEVPPATTATESETNCNMGPTAGTATFTGFGTATYTSLHTAASMSLTGASFSSAQDYSSYARIIDNLDIESGGGSVSYISFGIAIDGTWSNAGLSFVKPVLTFGFDYGDTGSNAPFIQTNLPASNGSVNTVFWTPFYPIADFEDYDYYISLSLQIAAAAGAGQTASGDLDFSNTASIVGIDATDANGNFVANVQATSQGLSQTGQNVTFADVNTPEPSTFALGCFSALSLALWRLRSRIRKRA